MAAALPIVVEPALVEEAVLHGLWGSPHERSFRHERDRVYRIPEPDAREAEFQRVHLRWFEELALAQPIHVALAELPILAESCARVLVARAATRKDEAADLLIGGDSAGLAVRSVLIRVRSTRLADAARSPSGLAGGSEPTASGSSEPTPAAGTRLLDWLRAELLHVADMIDPAFGYEPSVPREEADPAHERLMRDRYRVLWDVSIAGRLVRRGSADASVRDAAWQTFAEAFPMLGGTTEDLFAGVFRGEVRTHRELLGIAAAPRHLTAFAAHGLPPGGRCPLCRFPTYASYPTPERLPKPVIACITADFPCWEASHGLCVQCADLYRARATAAESPIPLDAPRIAHRRSGA